MFISVVWGPHATTQSLRGVFRPRVCSRQRTRGWPLHVPRDGSPPASRLTSIERDQGHQPSSQLRRVLPRGSQDYVGRALRHGERERSSSLWLRLHHSFGSPQYAIAAHCFCKSIGARRPCTRHQSTVNAEPPRSTSTVQKPSSSPTAATTTASINDAQVRVTQKKDGRQEIETPARRADAGHRFQ